MKFDPRVLVLMAVGLLAAVATTALLAPELSSDTAWGLLLGCAWLGLLAVYVAAVMPPGKARFVLHASCIVVTIACVGRLVAEDRSAVVLAVAVVVALVGVLGALARRRSSGADRLRSLGLDPAWSSVAWQSIERAFNRRGRVLAAARLPRFRAWILELDSRSGGQRTCVVFPVGRMPSFRLAPESWGTRLVDWLDERGAGVRPPGVRDIDFGDDDEFSRRYLLLGRPEAAVRRFFTARLRSRLRATPRLRASTLGPLLVVESAGPLLTSGALARFVRDAARLAAPFRANAAHGG